MYRLIYARSIAGRVQWMEIVVATLKRENGWKINRNFLLHILSNLLTFIVCLVITYNFNDFPLLGSIHTK